MDADGLVALVSSYNPNCNAEPESGKDMCEMATNFTKMAWKRLGRGKSEYPTAMCPSSPSPPLPLPP